MYDWSQSRSPQLYVYLGVPMMLIDNITLYIWYDGRMVEKNYDQRNKNNWNLRQLIKNWNTFENVTNK